jgi:hypothetical protein
VSRYGCGRRKGKNEDMYAREQIRSSKWEGQRVGKPINSRELREGD